MNPAIIALVYSDSEAADATLRRTALALLEAGHNLAGLVQHDVQRPGRSRCDMALEDLGGGDTVAISQDRGPGARGCRLDLGQLLHASELVRRSLAQRPDIVLLNKFGKSESEGGGFRDLIGEVVAAEIPLLIGVPLRNLDNWRRFAGEPCAEVHLEAPDASFALWRALAAALPTVAEGSLDSQGRDCARPAP